MTEQIAIRLAVAEDVAFLPAIERSAGQSFLAIPELAWLAQDDVTSEGDHRSRICAGATWVSEVDAQIVGFLSAEASEEALHVWELAVHFDRQNKGIGRALVMQAIGYARSAGLSSVTLTTFITVPWNAPFYSSVGFGIVRPENLSPRLVSILNEEQENGLPPDLRCAMVLELE